MLNLPPSRSASDALLDAIDAIRYAPDGEQNDTINTEAFKLRPYIRFRRVSAEQVVAALTEAAEAGNHPTHRAVATIKSGLGEYWPG